VIEFGPEICGNLEEARRREWLETNGLGGFASSTLAGLNTRRYHGLLTAATRPPVGRMLLLSKLEETLVLDGRRFELSANQYPDAVHPQGYRHLVRFRLDPFPTFTWRVEGFALEKTVFMLQGENTTVIQYELRPAPGAEGDGAAAAASCSLELRPLVACRDFHTTTHVNDTLRPEYASEPGLVTLEPYEGVPAFHLAHDAEAVETVGEWYRSFQFELERERGLDCVEDLFCPLVLRFDLARRRRAAVIASTERRDAEAAADYRHAEELQRRVVSAAAPALPEAPAWHAGPGADGGRPVGSSQAAALHERLRLLSAAAEHYLAARGDRRTIIAGYPWFADWGRDTMIALPGLTLVTGRFDVARSLLLGFARYLDQGMIPNRFPDEGEAPEYNTVDATLWYVEAVRGLLDYTDDFEFVRRELYDALVDVVEWHVRGTRHGIRVDGDGLLTAGEDGVALTWMDAKVDGWVVTPRRGKPVEVQALWYNALCVMADLARRAGESDRAERYAGMAAHAKGSFNEQFWNEAAGCLFDVVDGERRDGSIRPNQVLAVSLPHGMLDPERERRVVEVVERELLTPYGLRSLARGDAQYRGVYAGDRGARDGAYHQGTVWPWLVGPFVTAYLKVNGGTREARRRAAERLAAFDGHLRDAGVGHVSEIFDGEPPHHPRGCFAQAWSVAELLRTCVEDVLLLRPSERAAEPVAAAPVAKAPAQPAARRPRAKPAAAEQAPPGGVETALPGAPRSRGKSTGSGRERRRPVAAAADAKTRAGGASPRGA
jgi:glycogen debranching enzyme